MTQANHVHSLQANGGQGQPRSTSGEGSLTEALLEHWLEHPDRQDSLEGIIEWWLLEARIEHAIQQVKSALEELVKRGLVSERQSGDGQIYYRLNAEQAFGFTSRPVANVPPGARI